ncbi:MAG: hypothetical protein UIC45_07660 [Paludibacteraceae bacterium]|nr:hypothetical protein [Paludibacteraceae bacterium]
MSRRYENNVSIREDFIEINLENYNEYSTLNDIVAFYFSEIGAMGSPGRFIVITKDKSVYTFSIFELPDEIIRRLIPVFFECNLVYSKFKNLPMGWNGVFEGAGNYVLINDSIFQEYKLMTKGNEDDPFYHYHNWIAIVRGILAK